MQVDTVFQQDASLSAGREAAGSPGEDTAMIVGGGFIFTFFRPHSLYSQTLGFSFEDFFLFSHGYNS